MVGTTGEVVTFKVCVVEEVTVDDDVRKCGDDIRPVWVGAFVVVTRETIIQNGNSKLI